MRLLVEPKFDLYVDVITTKAKQTPGTIHLQWGELASVPPEIVGEFFREAFERGLTHYSLPHGDLDFRRVLVDKLARKNGIRVDVDNVIVTVGGTAAINFVFRIIAGDGGVIVIQDPAWFGYKGIADYVGARVVRLRETDYSYENLENIWRDLQSKGVELRGIVMNYPSNPTGYIFSVEVMKEVLEFARDHDVLIISDEAYEDYVFEGQHISVASLGDIDHVVSVYTISKTYSFTGLRIGYAVGRKDLIDAMALAQVHTYISPPAINQYVAKRLIEENIAEDIVARNLSMLRENLKIVKRYAESEGWGLVEPRGGIYVFLWLPGIDSASFGLKLLEKYGVAIAPGIDFGDNWREWIRITIARDPKELEEGLKRIAQFYREYRA